MQVTWVLGRQAYASQSIFPDKIHISFAPGSEAQLEHICLSTWDSFQKLLIH